MHGEMSAINRFSTLTAIAAGMIVTAAAFIFFALLGLSGVPQVNLDDQLHVQVIRAGESQDGSVVSKTSAQSQKSAAGGNSAQSQESVPGENLISLSEKAEVPAGQPLAPGDRSVSVMTLHDVDKLTSNVLCFRADRASVDVYIDGKKRGGNGAGAAGASDEAGKTGSAGLSVITIPLYSKDFGKEVRIEMEALEGYVPSAPQRVLLLRVEDAAKYPLIGHELKMTALLALMTAAVLLFVYALISVILRRRFGETLLLCVMLFAFSASAFEACGFFGLFLAGPQIGSAIGTCASFAAPVTFAAFLAVSMAPHKKMRKRIYTILALLLTAGVAAILILHTVRKMPLSDFEIFLEIATSAVLIFVILVERGALLQSVREDAEDVLVRIGVRLGAVFAVLDLLINNLWRFNALQGASRFLPVFDYRTCGLCAVSAFWLLYEWRKMGRYKRREENRELMKRLSYTDILCNVPNRHYCDRKIADISKHMGYQATLVEYTIFMMDVDYLREVNESAGFDAGDEMIRCVAEAIADAMRGCGADELGIRSPQIEENAEAVEETKDCFYGRWGGDEFVACTFRSQADAFETTLTSRIAAINIEKRLPFQVSVSIGSSDFQSGSYDRITRALALADRAMFERKTQYHEAHSRENMDAAGKLARMK